MKSKLFNFVPKENIHHILYQLKWQFKKLGTWMKSQYGKLYEETDMNETLYPALQLTDACNKRCRGCLRVSGENSRSRDIKTILSYLKDIECLGGEYNIGFQFVTGGEPTIWKEGEKDVADILNLFSKKSVFKNITMPTNGKRFENSEVASDILGRISNSSQQPIIVGLSISNYQENFINSRSIALDNLLTESQTSGSKIVPVALVTLLKEDDMDQRLKQFYPEVIQRVTPLAPLGAGEAMMNLCPSLSLSGNDKKTLGDFLPYFRQDVMHKLKLNGTEFDSAPNAEIINQLSTFAHCGCSPFIDDKWHYCLPFREYPEYDLAPIGEMNHLTLKDYINRWPYLKYIRENGILATVEHFRSDLSSLTQAKLSNLYDPDIFLSVAYRGCMVCKALADIGVWEEVRALFKT